MRPLRVALVTRPGSIPGQRNVGWWAYPVPEFAVEHHQVAKGATLSRVKFHGFDLIVWEDGKSVVRWLDDGPPLAYVVSDSTLSEEHYQRRLRMGAQADLILVDWDRLERFQGLGKPVRRFSHAVNDRRFRDWGLPKDTDVCYHIHEDTPERRELGDWLTHTCRERGYSFARGTREGDDYARAFNRAKVTVNLGRNPETRSHRILDAMGCRTCVLTDTVPDVSGEERTSGEHYLVREGPEALAGALSGMVGYHGWQEIAQAGYRLVRECHTWQARARQLRATLEEVGID